MDQDRGEMVNKRLRVEVTAADITRGQRNDSFNCVVAQALARTVKGAQRFEVDTQSLRFTEGGARYIYPTPAAVQGYVVDFDAGNPPQPFRFTLRYARRVQLRRRLRTAKGLAADRAAREVRLQARRAKTTAAPDEVRAAYDAALANYPAEIPTGTTVSHGPHATPRVFKTKTRVYGHRALRINQARDPVPA